MALVKLLPEQIAYRWSLIKESINKSLPATVVRSPDMMNKLLEKLLNGEMQCWAGYKDSDNPVIDLVVVTGYMEDFGGIRNLLIYSAYRTSSIEHGTWRTRLSTLKKFAKHNSCVQLCAFTTDDSVVRLVEWLGGSVNCKFVTIPLEDSLDEDI